MECFDEDICETQSEIYKYMARRKYDMETFSDCYLKSAFCENEMDKIFSPYHQEFSNACADEFLPEIEPFLKKQENASDITVAGYAGYLYRKLHIETAIPSKKLPEIISYAEIMEYCKNIENLGFDEVTTKIIDDKKLPRCRYDKDEVILSPHEMKELEERVKEEERQELRELGIDEDLWSPWLKENGKEWI